MHKILKQSTTFFLIATLILIPFGTGAMAQDSTTVEDSGSLMVFDVLLARPLGIVATTLGAAVWIVSLPFSAMGGNSKTAYRKLIAEPANYTFKRPLGEF